MDRISFYRLDNYSGVNLERVYSFFDRLHDICAEGHLTEVTERAPAEVSEYLHEICYTAEETIREIQAHEARVQAVLEAAILE